VQPTGPEQLRTDMQTWDVEITAMKQYYAHHMHNSCFYITTEITKATEIHAKIYIRQRKTCTN